MQTECVVAIVRTPLDNPALERTDLWETAMLKPRYPYYLANEAVFANENLEVADKFSGETGDAGRVGGRHAPSTPASRPPSPRSPRWRRCRRLRDRRC